MYSTKSQYKILNDMLGSHIPFCKTVKDTIQYGINMGFYSIQFFLGSPKSFSRKDVSDRDIELSQKLLKRFPMNVFSHAPYLFNLAGSKNILAWNGDDGQDGKTKIVIQSLEYELKILSKFSGGVIIHPGNYVDKEKGLETISKSINKIIFSENSKLLLENSAGQGTSLARDFHEIRKILDGIDKSKRKYIGCCIDTAHTFGSGLYDLSKLSEMKKMFQDFEEIVGKKYLSLIHLNDSLVPCGSKKDRHALIGTGYIWGNNRESLDYLLEYCTKNKIPIVLETIPENTYDV